MGAVEESVAEAQHAVEALSFGAARGPSETNHLALLGLGEALAVERSLLEVDAEGADEQVE